jgi:hypothetical protein
MMIPFGLVIFIFELVGVGDFIYPILIPIFIGVGGFIVFLFAMIFLAMRCATNTQSSTIVTKRQHTTRFSDDLTTPSRPVYKIPMNCPSCQRAIEPDRVEWRDNQTIVCPGCFADIEVESSY